MDRTTSTVTRRTPTAARRSLRDLRSQRGFSLIEVLVALGILSFLAVVVVFAVITARDRADAAACRADKQTLQRAVQSYRAKTGYFPSNQGILVTVLLDEPSTMWTYEPPPDLRTGTPSYSPNGDCPP